MGPYELVGYDLFSGDDDDDDDDIGAIGADLLVGADDDDLIEALVSGAGDSEIVGAKAKAKSKAKRRALVRAIAKRRAGAVVRQGLATRRRYPFGFLPTNIGAGVTQAVPANPQNLIRSERLVVPSDIAFDFGIRDVKVGNSSQFVQNVEVPAACFSEVSIDTEVTFDTAEVGNQISLDVRNKSGGAIEFTAAIIGTVAKR